MKLEKDRLLIIIAVICVLLFGVLYSIERRRGVVTISAKESPTVTAGLTDTVVSAKTEQPPIKVHIAGAVVNPGVYEAEPGSRVQDILHKAGGPAQDADLDRINLAGYIQDAQQIVIPKISSGEPEEAGAAGTSFAKQEALVNINTAGLTELMRLPGIGEVTAGNIIAYREKNGAFSSKIDIKKVPRIGNRTYEQIEDLITIE